MAASVRIEDEAFSDARIELLGTLAGYNRFEALGRMAHLWRLCTQRQLYVLSELLVVSCLGPNGAENIIAAELGERVEGPPPGIRIKGTATRIEWLSSLSSTRQQAGKARATNAPRDERGRLLPRSDSPAHPANHQQPSSSRHDVDLETEANPAVRQLTSKPPAAVQQPSSRSPAATQQTTSSPPAKSSAPAPAPAPAPAQEDQTAVASLPPLVLVPASQEAPDPAPPKPEGYTETVALYFELYGKQTGSKPTWGKEQGAMIKRLLGLLGAAEVQARMRRLYGGAIADWCAPPYDLGTFVKFVDRLAAVVPVAKSYAPPGSRKL